MLLYIAYVPVRCTSVNAYCTDVWTFEQMTGWTYGQMDVKPYGWMTGRIAVWVYRWLKGELSPCISSQKYNEATKKIFTTCGVNRIVTVPNKTTGAEENHSLNKIASSHIARRTFIGNLNKKVQAPNLVGVLSDKKEGNKAFVRCRDIDKDMENKTRQFSRLNFFSIVLIHKFISLVNIVPELNFLLVRA